MTTQSTVLVLDDEPDFRDNLSDFLEMKGYQVYRAGDAETGWTIIQDNDIHAALVDVVLPDQSGLTLLDRLKKLDLPVEVVVITGEGSVDAAVKAMQRGAFHYITKPLRLQELGMVVQRACEKSKLLRENLAQREGLRRGRMNRPDGMVTKSPKMKKLLREAERIAATDGTVLIEGETGVGKELIADFIYRHSRRKDQILSVVNCGSLAESLIDAELFGYEKGAFTGATERRLGLIEVSHKGTLFLDEIGDIPMVAQVRFLRFLEGGRIRRIGATREQELDVRIVAATHRDLKKEVREGRFREDLYHRLLVFLLRVPPLRERPEDILPLAQHFLLSSGSATPDPPLLDKSAQDALLRYPWPGNVRELAHTMERAVFAARFAESNVINSELLNLFALSDPEPPKNRLAPLKEIEGEHIQWVLGQMEGNRRKTAEVLGISERHLYRLINSFLN